MGPAHFSLPLSSPRKLLPLCSREAFSCTASVTQGQAPLTSHSSPGGQTRSILPITFTWALCWLPDCQA